MNTKLKQQIQYMSLFLGMKLRSPSAWDFSGTRSFVPEKVEIGGQFYSGEQVQEVAIQAKREGNYADAVGLYIRLLEANYREYGMFSAALVRAYVKILFAANEYFEAFSLIATMVADMQRSRNVNKELEDLVKTDFETLYKDAIAYVDRGVYYQKLLMLTIGYSGNPSYELEKTSAEIERELVLIRNKVREVYNI